MTPLLSLPSFTGNRNNIDIFLNITDAPYMRRPEVVAAAEQEVGRREQGRPDGGEGALAVGAAKAVLVPRPTDGAQQPAVLDRPATPGARRASSPCRRFHDRRSGGGWRSRVDVVAAAGRQLAAVHSSSAQYVNGNRLTFAVYTGVVSYEIDVGTYRKSAKT